MLRWCMRRRSSLSRGTDLRVRTVLEEVVAFGRVQSEPNTLTVEEPRGSVGKTIRVVHRDVGAPASHKAGSRRECVKQDQRGALQARQAMYLSSGPRWM